MEDVEEPVDESDDDLIASRSNEETPDEDSIMKVSSFNLNGTSLIAEKVYFYLNTRYLERWVKSYLKRNKYLSMDTISYCQLDDI